jgi:hypothetical protein
MVSIHDAVYEMIRDSAPKKGLVDMTLLWENLNEAGVEGECYDDTIRMLEEQGLLMVCEDGQLLLAKTEWRCPDCLGIVHGFFDHMDDCLKQQRKLKQIKKQMELWQKGTENKTPTQP